MEILYANNKVRKCFEDYNQMQRIIPYDWARTIKKHMDRLQAAQCFGDFLTLGLGKPEWLKGYSSVHYSLRVTPNVRLVLELDVPADQVNMCTEVTVEGVCDYHGGKENWYIP